MSEQIVFIDDIGGFQANMGFTGEEIVRCRDCKYLEEIEKETYYGTVVSWYECTELWEGNEEHKEVELDYFCAWGVKRNDN